MRVARAVGIELGSVKDESALEIVVHGDVGDPHVAEARPGALLRAETDPVLEAARLHVRDPDVVEATVVQAVAEGDPDPFLSAFRSPTSETFLISTPEVSRTVMPDVPRGAIMARPVPYDSITTGFVRLPASSSSRVTLPRNRSPPLSRSRSPGRKRTLLTWSRVRQGFSGDRPSLLSSPSGLT